MDHYVERAADGACSDLMSLNIKRVSVLWPCNICHSSRSNSCHIYSAIWIHTDKLFLQYGPEMHALSHSHALLYFFYPHLLWIVGTLVVASSITFAILLLSSVRHATDGFKSVDNENQRRRKTGSWLMHCFDFSNTPEINKIPMNTWKTSLPLHLLLMYISICLLNSLK